MLGGPNVEKKELEEKKRFSLLFWVWLGNTCGEVLSFVRSVGLDFETVHGSRRECRG